MAYRFGQIYNIGKDFVHIVNYVDSLEINPYEKIIILQEYISGYKRGFEIGTGSELDIKEISILFNLNSDIEQFGEQLGYIGPSEDPKADIQPMASSAWQEIIKHAADANMS